MILKEKFKITFPSKYIYLSFQNILYIFILSEEKKRIPVAQLREDTHKKVFFFSGRTTKGVGRVNPPVH